VRLASARRVRPAIVGAMVSGIDGSADPASQHVGREP
jgi:hypothetical protein